MAKARCPQFLDGWLASIPHTAIETLGSLRAFSSIEVCESTDQLIWIRGPRLEQNLQQALRCLPNCELYRPLDDGQLVPHEATVPQGHAPKGSWKALRDWLTLSLPARRFPALTVSSIGVSLVRSPHPEPPGLVLTSLLDWSHYAKTAPRVRLEPLQFASCRDSTIIVGKPLPPIRGDYYYLRQGIAVPVGYAWMPRLNASVLKNALKLEDDDVALLLLSGACLVVRSAQFMGATRSAVRLTKEAIDAE